MRYSVKVVRKPDTTDRYFAEILARKREVDWFVVVERWVCDGWQRNHYTRKIEVENKYLTNVVKALQLLANADDEVFQQAIAKFREAATATLKSEALQKLKTSRGGS
jgi:hypothetical protein